MLVGNNVGLSGTSGQGWAFWAGSNDAGSAPFRVGHDGSLSATTGNIGGWVIESNGIYQRNAFGNVSVTTGVGGIDAIGTSDIDFLRVQKSDGTYPFYVHKDGEMYCSNANIAGTINASNGTIGGITINSNSITAPNFSLSSDGALTATNANITGTINADKGKIAGFQIDESYSGYPIRMRSRLVSYDDKSLISLLRGDGGLNLSAYRAEIYNGNDTGIFTSNCTTHSGASNTFLSGWSGSHWGLSCTTDLYLTSTGWDKKVYTVNGPSITSDRKAKNIIRDSLDAYDFIMHLKPIKFTWKKGKKVHMGFIAQDIYDYLHTKGHDNYDIVNATHNNDNVDNVQDYDDKDLDWHMSYNDVIAPLVETVQQLSKEVERLKRENKNN
jgi:hypothetical protein